MQIKATIRYHYTPIKWPKSGTLTTSNADEDAEQQELSFTAGGNAKWYGCFEDSLVASYKIKRDVIIQSSNCTPWYLIP